MSTLIAGITLRRKEERILILRNKQKKIINTIVNKVRKGELKLGDTEELETLADTLLASEDNTQPYKNNHEEYPYLSKGQLQRRKAKEIPFSYLTKQKKKTIR